MKITKSELKQIIEEAAKDFFKEADDPEALSPYQRAGRRWYGGNPDWADYFRLEPPKDQPVDPKIGRIRRKSDDPSEPEPVTDYLPYEMGGDTKYPGHSRKAQIDLFDPRYWAEEHMTPEELGGKQNVQRWYQELLDAGLDPKVTMHDAIDIMPALYRDFSLPDRPAREGVSKERIAKAMSTHVKRLMPMRESHSKKLTKTRLVQLIKEELQEAAEADTIAYLEAELAGLREMVGGMIDNAEAAPNVPDYIMVPKADFEAVKELAYAKGAPWGPRGE